MINHLFSSSILNRVYNFLDYFLYLNYNWYLNNSFYNFLDYSLYLFDSLLHLFDDERNLTNDLNFFDLNGWNIYSLLYCNQLLYFNYLFYDHFNFNNFWDLYSLLHYLLYNSRYLYYLLGNLFDLNNLFHNFIHVFDNLYRNVNHLLYLFNLYAIYYFLDNSINGHNNRYFNYPLYYPLNKMRNLNSSMGNLEGSKKFINFLITNLAMTHFNHSLIDF